MKFPRPCYRRAFTLIEILVAMAVFALILTAIYSSWSAVIRGSKVGREVAEDVQRTRISSRSLEDALNGTLMFAENAIYYSFVAENDGDFAQISFTSHLPDDFPGAGLFQHNAVRRVTFGVEANPNGGNRLYLEQMPMLEPVDSRKPPYKIILAPNVELFNLEFYDTTINPPEWTDEWLLTNQVPAAVKFALAIGGSRPGSKAPPTIVNRTVAIPSTAVVREYQINDAQPRQGGNPPPVPPPPRP